MSRAIRKRISPAHRAAMRWGIKMWIVGAIFGFVLCGALQEWKLMP